MKWALGLHDSKFFSLFVCEIRNGDYIFANEKNQPFSLNPLPIKIFSVSANNLFPDKQPFLAAALHSRLLPQGKCKKLKFSI